MNLSNKYLSSSKEKSARLGHDIGCSPSHQFTSHILRKFIDNAGPLPSRRKSENCGAESETEELFKKHEDLRRSAKCVAETNNYVGDVPSKAKKLALKRKLKVEQSRQQTECLRSEILRLRTRCSLLEDTVAELKKRIQRPDEKCVVVPAEMDRTLAEDTGDRGLTTHSSEKSEDSSCNTEALPEKHYEKVVPAEIDRNVAEYTGDQGLTIHSSEKSENSSCNTEALSEKHYEKESVDKVAEDGYYTDLSMATIEISSDGLHTSEEPPKQFSEEGCSRYSAQVALVEFIEEVTKDYITGKSSMLPLEISNDGLHNPEEQLEKFFDKVALVETAHDNAENARNTNLSIFTQEKSSGSHDVNAEPEQYSEGDPASKDSQNCFSDPTKDADYVFSNVPDDDEVVSGISVSPQFNHQLQTLRMGQVKNIVTTKQPNCNDDELNVCQRNGQACSSAECSKCPKNGGEGLITCSAKKKKKELPSLATLIQTSDSVPKKVPVVLKQDWPPYCCSICDKSFSYKSLWTTHQRKHSETRPYKCGFCDTRFKHNWNKLRHERYMHTKVACFECAICGKMLSRKTSSIVRHLRVHSGGKPFLCQTCGTSFCTKSDLVRHQNVHSKEKEFKCRVCDKRFKHQWSKTMHERLHVEGPRFECALCGKKYTQKHSLTNHISSNCKTSKKMVSKLFHCNEKYVEHVDDDNQFSNSTALSPQKLNDNGPCNAEAQSQQCSEKDPASADLQNCFSDRTKATDGVFSNILGDNDMFSGISVSSQINGQLLKNDTAASSTNEQFDKTHVMKKLRIELVRVTTQQLNCNDELNLCQRNGQISSSAECSKRRKNGDRGRINCSARTKKELATRSLATTIETSNSVPKKVLVREVSMGDIPPYCCNICDKSFPYKSQWTKHQRNHSEKRPYQCGFCDTRFKHKNGKLQHQRYMHTEVACFECAICGKMFSHKASLIDHLRIHSGGKPFRCQTCGTSFSRKSNLVAHQNSHSEEKTFKCRMCDQLFKYRHQKTEHERLHVEGPRFECALCGKKYQQKQSLAYHISRDCS